MSAAILSKRDCRSSATSSRSSLHSPLDSDIGHYYGEYARLMSHWESVLPGRFITVQYEDLVAGFDEAAPRLVAFCGLEWEEGCRNFSSTNRIIANMSAHADRKYLKVFRA